MQAAAFFQTQLPNKHTEDNEAQFTCSYSFIGQNAVASQSSRLPLHRSSGTIELGPVRSELLFTLRSI